MPLGIMRVPRFAAERNADQRLIALGIVGIFVDRRAGRDCRERDAYQPPEVIIAKLIEAPGNNAPLGGIKVVTQNGWFAVRPSGTEDVLKIYAESLKSKEHLVQIQQEARGIIQTFFRSAGVYSNR